MSSTPSRAQQEARREAERLYREVEAYRRILPLKQHRYQGAGVCRADGWNVSGQQLSGDFDLDEALARQLLGSLSSGVSARPDTTASTATSLAMDDGATSWIKEYLAGETPGAIGSLERFGSELKNAAIGPGNVLGNANAVKQAAHEALKSRTADKLQAAARAFESGTVSRVKLNQYVTIYNANHSGKGRPRPRVRISGMPMHVISPTLGPAFRAGARGVTAPVRAVEALKAQKLGKMMADTHWTGRAAFLNGRTGGGILTFGPSAALDAYHSIQRDLQGNAVGFDLPRFLIASARSQSGNVVGMMAGAMVTSLAPTAFAAVGLTLTGAAPVILVVLVAGVVAQALWGSFGGADWAEDTARQSLGR